jgi:hypothetical protein
LWRLHRASAIETGLFEIQGELQHDRVDAIDSLWPRSTF